MSLGLSLGEMPVPVYSSGAPSSGTALPEFTSNPAYTRHGSALASQDTVWSIGVIDGDDAEMFGSIVDATVGPNGDILVLDRHSLTLRWFGLNGKFRAVAGRAGGGPGEFRSPLGLAVDPDNNVHVMDAALRRISVFAMDSSGFSLLRVIPFRVNALNFCMQDEQYYVLALHDGSLISVLSPKGDLVRQFGRVIEAIPPEMERHRAFLEDARNRGRLICGPHALILVREQTPRISAYSYQGDLLWETEIRDFSERRWVPILGGRGLEMAPNPETGKVHNVRFAALSSTDAVAVSLRISAWSGQEAEFDVRVLSLADGREIQRRTSVSALFGRRDGWRYGVQDLPFPRIIVTATSEMAVRHE